MISARQVRAARALLDWKQGELARQVGVSVPTVKRMEKQGLEKMKVGTAEELRRVFTDAGIEFVNDGAREGAVIASKPKGKRK